MKRLWRTLRYVGVVIAMLGSVLLSAPQTAFASGFTVIQHSEHAEDYGGSSVTAGLSSGTSAGDTLVVAVSWGSNTTWSCDDWLGNSFTELDSIYSPSGNQSLGICYATNIAAGTDAVNVNFGSGPGYRRISAVEYSGIDLASPVDVHTMVENAATTATDNISSGSVTTTQNGDLVFGAVEFYDQAGTDPATPGTGFTGIATSGTGELMSEDMTQATAGSVQATATAPAAGSYLALVVAFRDASGGGSTSSSVSTVVDPTLTFVIAGHAGTCNGVAQSAGSSASATTVGLGHVNASTNGVAAQDLKVTTNATLGFSVFLRDTAQMNDGNGHTIANVSGTNASPGAFASAGSPGFGYTTSDTGLGTGSAARFFSGSATWAAPTTTNAEVSYASTGPVTNDTVCVAYQLGVASTTPAGTYSATVIYTAVPSF